MALLLILLVVLIGAAIFMATKLRPDRMRAAAYLIVAIATAAAILIAAHQGDLTIQIQLTPFASTGPGP